MMIKPSAAIRQNYGEVSRLCKATQEPPVKPDTAAAPLPLPAALSRAVSESMDALLAICGFVALFSALLQAANALSLPQPWLTGAAALLEVTSACGALHQTAPLPVLAAVIAWGGVCVHCQIAPYLAEAKLSLVRFWGGRTLHAALSFLCCRALLAVVRLPADVLAEAAAFRPAAQENYLLSFCMLMMCVLLLFGSRCTLRFRRAK